MKNKIKQLIAKGENHSKDHIEFKEARNEIPKSIYETVCAFLNTKGGDILLGVKDNGNVVGVFPDVVNKIKQNFTNTINNPDKINPSFYLSIEEVNIDGKIVLHIFVPESSQVHRCKNKIYMRNNEGDYDITNNQTAVARLYSNKQSSYSENKIFPYAYITDLRKDLIQKVRILASNQRPNHMWNMMDDITLLKTSSLYQKDPLTGKEGITLAGILLLGKDTLISSALPAFRIDLIKRVNNVDRYDDRVDLRTNLIESYERMMEFIEKHLPDPFYLEGTQRISLRNIIFREAIANMLIHKEYSRAEPTRLIIERDRIYTENSNKPFIRGIINLKNLQSHPKNPNIAKFFRQIGRAEEMGSGVVKFYKYCKEYTGSNPIIEDGNLFKFILPINFFEKDKNKNDQVEIQDKGRTRGDLEKIAWQITDQVSDVVTDQVSDVVNSLEKKIIRFCKRPKSLTEIINKLGYKSKIHFKEKILNSLIKRGLIKPTELKLTSSKQKYISVK